MADYNGLLGKLDDDCAARARKLASVDALWRITSRGAHYITPFYREGHKKSVDSELGSIVEDFKKEHPEVPVHFHPQPAARYHAMQAGLSAKQEKGLAFLLHTRQTIAMKTVTPDSHSQTSPGIA